MEKSDRIVLEATGSFPFEFCIEKAIAVDEMENEQEEMVLEGIASTTNVDHDNERMSESALKAMESAINGEGVPLRVEHDKKDSAVIGRVFKAWVDERNQLHIKARLDKSHAVSSVLWNSMKNEGKKMGLSVGGIVKRAVTEFVESTGNKVKTFYEVALNEVSVTPRPANYDSYVYAKSITEDEEDGDRFRETAFYNDFLKEFPKLDYLQVFAKSVPDKAWHKVASTNNNSMNKDEKTETTETDTEKAVSRQEFKALSDMVAKGFKTIGSALSKMTDDAMDQVNPDEKKDEEVEGAAKSETETETKEKAETETETETKSETEGTDTEGTREKKAKKSETETMTSEEKKARKTETTDTETKEKAEDTTDEYDLEHVSRAIKTIKAIGDRARKTETTETETKEKAEAETETDTTKAEETTETETTKGMHPVDVLAMTVAKTLEAMEEKMQKGGYRMLGFEKHQMDALHNDPVFQEEVAKMMKVAGPKRSVSMGVPYVTTKDGRRYSLIPAGNDKTTIEKSQSEDAQKSFKDTYKAKFASIREGAEQG